MSIRDVISIFYPDSKARSGELVVDGFVQETHTFTSRLTEHPVESGGSIVDHVQQEPFMLCYRRRYFQYAHDPIRSCSL